jgi:hypothetical protein
MLLVPELVIEVAYLDLCWDYDEYLAAFTLFKPDFVVYMAAKC